MRRRRSSRVIVINPMRTSIVALALVAAFAAPAWAETRTIQTSGLWSSYGGTDDNNRAVCGISTAGADGRRVSIQQAAGETELVFMLEKPSWAIPDNTPIDLQIQFDNGQPNPDRATGTGNRVSLSLPFERSVAFMRLLRERSQLRVYFPNGNETPWTGGLGGSSGAINAFNDCRAALAPSGPTQPFPASPANPTQPFPSRP
jgi:hypothetical protein